MNDKYFAWDPRGFSRRMPRPFLAGVGEPNSGKNGTAESTYRCEGVAERIRQRKALGQARRRGAHSQSSHRSARSLELE
jgi:hypothetical protein